MCTVEALKDDHLKIMVLANELARYLEYPSAPSSLPLFQVRAALATLLIRHLKVEDWVVYPALKKSSDPEVREVASTFAETMGGLADAFREHMEKWTAPAIASDWRAYRSEAATLLNALEHRIQGEEDRLYPLALHNNAVSL